MALRQLSNRRLRRAYWKQTTKATKRIARQHLEVENRELRYDDCSERVEEIMRRLNKFIYNHSKDDCGNIANNGGNDVNDDGWMGSALQGASPSQLPLDFSSNEYADMLLDSHDRPLPVFDPHSYAMTKKTNCPHRSQKRRRRTATTTKKLGLKRKKVRGNSVEGELRHRRPPTRNPAPGKRKRRSRNLQQVQNDENDQQSSSGASSASDDDLGRDSDSFGFISDEQAFASENAFDASTTAHDKGKHKSKKSAIQQNQHDAISVRGKQRKRRIRYIGTAATNAVENARIQSRHSLSFDGLDKSNTHSRLSRPTSSSTSDTLGDVDDPNYNNDSVVLLQTQEQLFSALDDMGSCSSSPSSDNDDDMLQQTIPANSGSLTDLCKALSDSYPSENNRSTLKRIIMMLQTQPLIPPSGSDSPPAIPEHGFLIVLKTILNILVTHGSLLLQAFVSNNCSQRPSATLSVHIGLLVTALRILGLYSKPEREEMVDTVRSLYDDEDSAITFRIFFSSDGNRINKSFLDFLLLQLVDSIYSLVHPSAWSIRLTNPSKVLRDLEPLRNAVSEHVPLMERVCEMLTNQLAIQKWRSMDEPLNGQCYAFVSTVDPEAWRAFLISGKPPAHPESKQCRISALPKVSWPRCEVDALWRLLAYFAEATSTRGKLSSSNTVGDNNDKGMHRWDLLSRLLAKSGLSSTSSTEESKLPVSETQLQTITLEVRSLAALLGSGTMGNLPAKDSFLKNFVEKSLAFEADNLANNQEARTAAGPVAKNEKEDTNFARILWEAALPDLENNLHIADYCSVASVAKSLRRSITVSSFCFMGQPLFLPSSPVSRGCLALLCTWIARIPPKAKARHCRLAKVWSSLTKGLINLSSSLEENVSSDSSHGGNRDLFQEAFASFAPTQGDLGNTRKVSFLRENAAYLTVIGALSLHLNTLQGNAPTYSGYNSVRDLGEKVWKILSDVEMQQSQEKLTFIVREDTENYQGDIFRPYLASKVIAFLALAFLDVPPWEGGHLYQCKLTKDPIFKFRNTEADNGTLVYLVSCLLACLDCACNVQNCEVEILSAILSSAGIILVSSIRVIMVAEASTVVQQQRSLGAIRELAQQIVPLIQSTCDKCFWRLATASYCGKEEDICLTSILTLIRAASVLTIYVRPKVLEVINDSPTNLQAISEKSDVTGSDDDLWGGIDDSHLAAMDLGGADQTSSDARPTTSDLESSITAIQRVLARSLEEAKPSTRFSISHHPGTVSTSAPNCLRMSVQGRALIARNKELVCGSLAATSMSLGRINSSNEMDSIMRSWLIPAQAMIGDADQQLDIVYRKEISQRFTSELCSLASCLPRVTQSFRWDQDLFLFSIVETLLDIKLLQKMPSCNIDHIEIVGGSSSAAKELHKLRKFSQGSSLYKASKNVWMLSDAFGRILDKWENDNQVEEDSRIGRCFKEFDFDVRLGHFQLGKMPSVESECFDRFRLFRGLITTTAAARNSSARSDRLNTLIFTSSASRLLQLAKSISIYDRARDVVGQDPYERAKILEVFSSYAELQMSLVAWISLEGSQLLWRAIRDRYLIPILQEDANFFDILSDAIAFIGSLAAGKNLEAKPTKQAFPNKSDPCLRIIFNCILRRGRQFMIRISRGFSDRTFQESGIFLELYIKSLVRLDGESEETYNDQICRAVARSFGSEPLPPGARLTGSSPLRIAMEEYFAGIDGIRTLKKEQKKDILKLKQYALKFILVPGLVDNTKTKEESEKSRILRLTRSMLEIERDEDINVNDDDKTPRLGAVLLCSVARGIKNLLRGTLESRAVNNDLVSDSFRCAKALVNIPANCVDHNAAGWLIHWCAPTSTNVPQVYLWWFCCWLNQVGIAMTNYREDPSVFESYRESLRHMASGDDNSWPRLGESDEDFMAHMIEEENRIFPDARSTTNPYTARRIVDLNEPLHQWSPTDDTLKSVAAFTALVSNSIS